MDWLMEHDTNSIRHLKAVITKCIIDCVIHLALTVFHGLLNSKVPRAYTRYQCRSIHFDEVIVQNSDNS